MKKTLLWLAVLFVLASVPVSVFADANPSPICNAQGCSKPGN